MLLTRPLPKYFNQLFRQSADVSLLRLSLTLYTGNGILTICPSDSPFGYSLGPDLP